MEQLTQAQIRAERYRQQVMEERAGKLAVYEQQATRIKALAKAGKATERDMVWLLANDPGLEVRARETRAKKQRKLARLATASMPESFFNPSCLWRV